jgi:hypothetical protein
MDTTRPETFGRAFTKGAEGANGFIVGSSPPAETGSSIGSSFMVLDSSPPGDGTEEEEVGLRSTTEGNSKTSPLLFSGGALDILCSLRKQNCKLYRK